MNRQETTAPDALGLMRSQLSEAIRILADYSFTYPVGWPHDPAGRVVKQRDWDKAIDLLGAALQNSWPPMPTVDPAYALGVRMAKLMTDLNIERAEAIALVSMAHTMRDK